MGSSPPLTLVLNTRDADEEGSQTLATFVFPLEGMASASCGFPGLISDPHWLHLLPLSLGVSEWVSHLTDHRQVPDGVTCYKGLCTHLREVCWLLLLLVSNTVL